MSRDYLRFWPFRSSSGDSSPEEGKQFPQLREFVYIDQRSVRSLLASTDSGRVAEGQTSRESSSNTTKHSANAGTGTGPVNLGVGTSRASMEGNETENVYSFDLIQSKFTRLYEHEDLTPKISVNSENEYDFQDNPDLSELDRGALLELRGTIQLHPLYRVYQAIRYSSSAAPDETAISEGDMQLIEESLGDKIPIEVEVDGLSIGDGGSIIEGSQGETFNVVSLLDETELWTEPIQTLASNKQFRVYCRVEAVKPDWYPMKLTRVLESISAPLAEKFSEELESELQTAMNQFEAEIEISSERIGMDHQKTQDFSEFLAGKSEETIEADQIDEIVEHAAERYSPETTVTYEQDIELLKQTHESFTEIVHDIEFSQDAASLRSEYLQQSDQAQPDDSERDLTTHLEANVIGVYW